ADAGVRVAVVDADFRRPAQARIFAIDGARGLAGVLSGAMTLRQAMQPVGVEGAPLAPNGGGALGSDQAGGSLVVLPSGGEVDNPSALLGGPVMRSVLRTLAEDFDHVL